VRSGDIDAIYTVVDDTRRNLLITQSYCELSHRMRALVGPDGTWCTFSTWSSRTIGYFIRGDLDPLTEYRLQRMPRWLRPVARPPTRLFNRIVSRSRHRAGPRLLARGNREIFAEIAREFARFVDTFEDPARRTPAAWTSYRTNIVAAPATDLFPAAPVELMRDGFAAYFDAILEPDAKRRAELVLRGNILLADYEQRRVDPIVRAALSLFPSRLLNDDPDDPELLTIRDKKPWALQDTGRIRTWIDETYGRFVTRWRMAIVLPAGEPLPTHSELIRVGVGLPKPVKGAGLYGAQLADLSLAPAAAAFDQHDRAHGDYRAAGARSWRHLADRMNCIVNVFRARQDRALLYEIEPLTPEELSVAFARPERS